MRSLKFTMGLLLVSAGLCVGQVLGWVVMADKPNWAPVGVSLHVQEIAVEAAEQAHDAVRTVLEGAL